jgi:hypothetical protein
MFREKNIRSKTGVLALFAYDAHRSASGPRLPLVLPRLRALHVNGARLMVRYDASVIQSTKEIF